MFSLLPFIGQEAVFNLGAGESESDKKSKYFPIRASTALGVFSCPSRRPPSLYPHTPVVYYRNMDKPSQVFRGDYAANGGSYIPATYYSAGPWSLTDGDSRTQQQWESCAGAKDTGIIFLHSQLPMCEIVDGASHTYLAGEKYCCPDYYYNATSGSDDQVYDCGPDHDVQRWCGYYDSNAEAYVQTGVLQDTPGYGASNMFGSAHANGFHMALCDGSVQLINYTIDPVIHMHLGDRRDGMVIDSNDF